MKNNETNKKKNMSIIIKSKERVRDLAEVYTSEREVNAMLDLVEDTSYNIESRFLEPACGNGNFLIKILDRKLKTVFLRHKSQQNCEFYSLVALSNMYGVDICAENVEETKVRLMGYLKECYSLNLNTRKESDDFYRVARVILDTNIIHGDMLNGTELISFTEYTTPALYKFKRKVFALSDMLQKTKKIKPISQSDIVNFLEMENVRDIKPGTQA